MAIPGNSLNITASGLVKFDGISQFSAVTVTQFNTLIGGASNSISSISPGNSGQVLTSNGNSANPSYQTPTSGTVTSVSGTANQVAVANGTTTPVISLIGPYTPATYTAHGVLIGEGTSSIVALAAGLAGQMLQSGGASANPAYSTATYPSTSGTSGTILISNGTNFVNTTATYPTTTTINQILFSSAANTISGISAGTNTVLIAGATSVPSFTNSLSNDFTLTGSIVGGNRIFTVANTDNTNSSSNAVMSMSVGGTSAGDVYDQYAIGSARSFSVGIDNSDSQSFKINTFNNGIVTPSTGSNVFRLDTSGNRSLPLNSCCTADLNTGLTNVTGDGTFINPIIFDTNTGSFFDQNSNYNVSTGIFTAPATGKYLVTARVTYNGLSALNTSGIIRINLNGGTYGVNEFSPGASMNASNEYTAAISMILPVSATGTIAILGQVSGSTKTVGVKGNTSGSYTSLSIVLVS